MLRRPLGTAAAALCFVAVLGLIVPGCHGSRMRARSSTVGEHRSVLRRNQRPARPGSKREAKPAVATVIRPRPNTGNDDLTVPAADSLRAGGQRFSKRKLEQLVPREFTRCIEPR